MSAMFGNGSKVGGILASPPHSKLFAGRSSTPVWRSASRRHWSIWHQLTNRAEKPSNPQSTSKLTMSLWSAFRSRCVLSGAGGKKYVLVLSTSLISTGVWSWRDWSVKFLLCDLVSRKRVVTLRHQRNAVRNIWRVEFVVKCSLKYSFRQIKW